jgi:hypothetical protein
MHRFSKRIRFIGIFIIMLAIMLQSTVPAMAAGTVSSNKCGAHVTYSISGSVLTIKGSGAMYDYSADTIPWLSKKDKITSIRVEDGVTVIGSYAFSRCKYVNQVRIPSSVSQIRTKAFSYCDSLENVSYTGSTAQYNRIDIMAGNSELKAALSTGVATIRTYKASSSSISWSLTNGTLTVRGKGKMPAYHFMEAPWFGKRAAIKRIVVGEGITAVSTYAFACCSNVTSVDLPDTLSEIGARAFYKDVSLASLELPSGLSTIGRMAFQDCTALKSLTIPSGVKKLPEYMCCGCSRLKEVVLPGTITEIGSSAFFDTALSQISYTGTKARWSCIRIDISNKKDISGAKLVIVEPKAATSPATSIVSVKNVKGCKAKVTYKTSSACDGYQIQVAKDRNFTKSLLTKKVFDKNDSDKVMAAGSKGTWYARVRTFRNVGGKTVYSAWSKVKSVKLTR